MAGAYNPLIEAQVIGGKMIKRDFPEARDAYEETPSSRIVVRRLDLMGHYATPAKFEKSMRNALLFALHGNSNPNVGPTYRGQFGSDEWAQVAHESKVLAGKECMKKARRRGTHQQPLGEKRIHIAKMHLATGTFPWGTKEAYNALWLAHDQEWSYSEVASQVNKWYHKGEKVRDQKV